VHYIKNFSHNLSPSPQKQDQFSAQMAEPLGIISASPEKEQTELIITSNTENIEEEEIKEAAIEFEPEHNQKEKEK